jgi:hypothetical protein
MIYEWDAAKNIANQQKHELSFEQACLIFEGPIFSRADKRFDYGEVRVLSIGRVDELLVLTVIHTDRNGNRRIISARRANQKERQVYEKFVQKNTECR